MIKKYRLIITIILLGLCSLSVQAGDDWRVSAGWGFSKPAGSLENWFKNGNQFRVALGRDLDNGWLAEGLIQYVRYDNENLTGYPKGKLDLYLEHVTIWASGKYTLLKWGNLAGYYAIAGGPLYWKGIRGKIDANEDLAIPEIDKKTLEEWNMGFCTGVGSTISLGPVGIDCLLNYRFVVGNLWPTMQEYIELDGVNGFHSINIDLGLFSTF